MAKPAKGSTKKPNVAPANAPCKQGFNLGNPKSSSKKKTWWNGYRPAQAKPSDL